MKPFTAMFGAALIAMATGQAMAQVGPADKTFATKAASGGRAEVSLGTLATQNATSPAVRQFGQQMVTDHTQANQELIQIAQKEDLTLPAKPAAADTAVERRLQNLKGQAFDTAYMQDMVQDHQQDIVDFRREAETGRDPALKAFAQKYLPILQQHLQMAQAAQGK